MANDNTQLAIETTRRLLEYQKYPNQFFSGADTRFYLFSATEELEVTTVAAVAYNLEEQVVPIRSYNEYKYRYISRGARLVTGTIAIFYTERDAFLRAVNGFISPNEAEEDDDEPGVTPMQSMWQETEEVAQAIDNTLFEDTTTFNLLPFDLMILVGATRSTSKSVHLITGIDIVSYQQRISNDGQPLVDEYQFIARDYASRERAIAEPAGQETNRGLRDSLNSVPSGNPVLTREDKRTIV